MNVWDFRSGQAVMAPRTNVFVFGSFVPEEEGPPPISGPTGFPMRFLQPRTE